MEWETVKDEERCIDQEPDGFLLSNGKGYVPMCFVLIVKRTKESQKI